MMRSEHGGSDSNVRHSPLLRHIDIVESRILRALITLTVILVPLAIFAGSVLWSSQGSSATAHVSTTQVTAVTDVATRASTPIATTLGSYSTTSVSAHWVWKDEPRTAVVTVPPNTAAGSNVTLTVDSNGNPAVVPSTTTDFAVTAAVVGLVLVTLVMGGYVIARRAVRRRFDHHRDKHWDRELTALFGQAG